MRVEYADGTTMLVDFVVPTVDEALKLIADSAVNAIDLLEQAGLSTVEVERELGRRS
jgi:hypothetical protein